MRRIIGIDPGLAGGLGVLDLPDDVALHRTPVVHVRNGRQVRVEYDVPAMRDLLTQLVGAGLEVEVVLEQQQAMPVALRGRAQGGRSTFRTGLGYGLWLALVVAARVRYRTVRPAVWKAAHRLVGTDKRASRLRCGERFPALAPVAAKDEGPAEGLLMAAWCAAKGAA